MRIWTFQTAMVYQQLLNQKVVYADVTHSEYIDWGHFRQAYDWLKEEMRERIDDPPAGASYPFWAWHTVRWQHQRPDLRLAEFSGHYGSAEESEVCLELEIPDDEVLLSDEEQWHNVLNDGYMGPAKNETELDLGDTWFSNLPSNEKEIRKRLSWREVFDVTPYEDDWTRRGQDVQATFWTLRLSDVVAVRKLAGAPVGRWRKTID